MGRVLRARKDVKKTGVNGTSSPNRLRNRISRSSPSGDNALDTPWKKALATIGAFGLMILLFKVTAPSPEAIRQQQSPLQQALVRSSLSASSPSDASSSSTQKHASKTGKRAQKRNPLFPKTSMFKDGAAKQQEKISKQGALVHKAITSVKKEDLKGLVDHIPDHDGDITYEEALEGRERLVEILADAGVEELDIPTLLTLPKWSSVSKLYGEEPVVFGLETCERFRKTIPLDDASIGTAGMFNTGTNPFAMYIEANCLMPHNRHDKHGGTRWQVPWGKHTMASQKWNNTAGHDHRVNKTNVLPIAIIRDPYTWMQSMCKHPYVAKWIHSKRHCPNLVPTPEDFKLKDNPKFPVKYLLGDTVGVRVKYDPIVEFKSLAHYWTQWYTEYMEADYPRLIVRFEDLQFHAKEMINIVCQCAGAVPRDPNAEFTYIVDAAKWGNGHRGKQTNLISAMIKYGTDKKRFDGLTKDDLQLAAEALDPELMQLFNYEIPSL